MLADGFSMAFGDYLSADNEYNHQIKIKSALATFGSFVFFGSIPLIPYVITIIIPSTSHFNFEMALIATSIALLGLGYVKSKLSNTSAIKGAIQMLIMGGIATLLAYGLSVFLNRLI